MPGTPPNPAHIAVFNARTHGHVNPTLAVVEELVRRGHRVSYAITDEFAPTVKAAGAEPVLYASANDGSEAPEDLGEGISRAVQQALASLPALTQAFDADSPDLVLCDMCAFAGLLLGARRQVPIVISSPTHLAYDGIVPEFFGVSDVAQIPGYTDLAAAFPERTTPSGTRRPPRQARASPLRVGQGGPDFRSAWGRLGQDSPGRGTRLFR